MLSWVAELALLGDLWGRIHEAGIERGHNLKLRVGLRKGLMMWVRLVLILRRWVRVARMEGTVLAKGRPGGVEVVVLCMVLTAKLNGTVAAMEVRADNGRGSNNWCYWNVRWDSRRVRGTARPSSLPRPWLLLLTHPLEV